MPKFHSSMDVLSGDCWTMDFLRRVGFWFGVRWDAGAFTVDLDFAHAGKNISLAIATHITVDTAKAIDSLEMGFIPIMSGTTYKKPDEPDFDLDFLTTFGTR